MRRITSMLFGVAVGGFLMFGALQYTVCRPSGFRYVRAERDAQRHVFGRAQLDADRLEQPSRS